VLKITADNSEISKIKNAIFIILSIGISIVLGMVAILGVDDWIRIILLLGLNALLIIVFIFTRFLINRVSDYDLYKKNQKYYDNLNLSFYTKELNKEVIIHDSEGTATIIYKYKITNISESHFTTLGNLIQYDGEFIKEDFSLEVDNEKYSWDKLVNIYPSILPVKVGGNYQKRIKFKIPLKNFLNPEESIQIILRYKITKVFSEAFLSKDNSSIKVPYPADYMKFKFKLDMDDYIIKYDDIGVEIDTVFTKDSMEESRIKNSSALLPKGDETNELIWEFDNPKVGNSYFLYFSCKRKIL